MKIALIQCPLWGTFDPPIALAQLSACLKNFGHDVRAYDLNIKLYLERSNEYKNVWAWEQSDFWYKPHLVKEYCVKNSTAINQYIEEMLRGEIRLACFSVNIASLYMSLELARILKDRNRDIKIVFGGPVFLQKTHIAEVLDTDLVDIIVLGEGEKVLCELADAINSESDYSHLAGVVVKRGGSVITNVPATPINLNTLPFLDFTDLPLHNYDDSKHIPFMASRGCIRRCHFCSDGPCWPGYRAMSGERLFQEIIYHRNTNKMIGHIDFLDLTFNGNMSSLTSFCELMIKHYVDLHWNANMVVRPEMSNEVVDKIARAGCEQIIFGIESGSERILKLMNKHYSVVDADRIIRKAHEVGICVTANFMFGFPGETEEDFLQTLDFLKRNAKYLDRCYPSRTYFAIEEFSYLYDHIDEFDIKPNPPNHLFWESKDGTNTYPVRLERCRRFCQLALELGVEVGKGVQTSVLQDEWFNLASYYETKKDSRQAVENYMRYYDYDQYSMIVNKAISKYYGEYKRNLFSLDEEPAKKLEHIASVIQEHDGLAAQSTTARLKPEVSMVYMKSKIKNLAKKIEGKEFLGADKWQILAFPTLLLECRDFITGSIADEIISEYITTAQILAKKNAKLNDWEFENKKCVLTSLPKTYFLQFAGPCNSSCVFCSRGHEYRNFDLKSFKEKIESKIAPYLMMAEQFVLTGSGEYLRLKEWREILEHLEYRYPHIEKMFSTNSSSLRPEVIDLITSQQSRYSIHSSLHASNASVHKIMTRMDNFETIVEQIEYLIKQRRKNNNVRIDLFFVATTLNIEDLPDFVRLAKKLGVDSVVVNYNYIYVPAQKYLSCFFKPELTNKMFDKAKRIAHDIRIPISLPPRFNEEDYPRLGLCRELWSQTMLNDEGHVLPCDASHDCHLRLDTVQSFYEIWNSEYYVKMRQELINSGQTLCFEHCHRANPAIVNTFSSHVIHRGRGDQKIDEFWEDNF